MSSYIYAVLVGKYRTRVFKSSADFAKCAEILKACLDTQKINLFHYCFLPTQIHLLMGGAPERTTAVFAAIQGEYASYFKKISGASGRMFQKYIPTVDVAPAALLSYGVMIENLPYRYGLTGHGNVYAYSSLKHYLRLARDPLVAARPESEEFFPRFRMPDDLYSDFLSTAHAAGIPQ